MPKGWKRVALNEVADSIQYGHTASAIQRADGPRFLRITDIQDGRVDWDTVPSCDIPKTDIPKYRLSKGDLVFARTGATTGKSFLIKECPEAVFASYLIRVRVSAELDSHFLSAFFQSPDYWNQIEGSKRGIGQPNVNGKVLGEVQLPVPPLPEQQRIVAEIEKQFSRLEEGVGALKRVQANLKRYRAAVLKAACEGRLVPTEAERQRAEGRGTRGGGKYETGEELLARILAERRKNWQGRGKYREPAVPDTAKLPPLPEGWAWVNIGQLKYSSLYGPRFSSDDYTDDGYVVLRTSDINESGKVDVRNAPRLRLSKEEFEKYRAKRGDLLVTRTGSLGTLAIFDDDIDSIPGAYLIKFRLATDPTTTRYLFYFLKTPAGQSYLAGKGAGVGRPNLNAPTIEALAVPLPPLAEQSRIVAEVERRLSVVEELEAAVAANLQRATRLRQSILQKAFEGKLVASA